MPTPILMPKLGMIMTEGAVSRWLKADGEHVQKGEPLLEVTTEKITYEVEASESGIVRPLLPEEEVVEVGTLIGYLLAEGEDMPSTPPRPMPMAAKAASSTTTISPAPVAPSGEGVRATPAARRLAGELGVDLARAQGSGPGGRVVEEDVRRSAERPARAKPAEPEMAEVVPLRGMRGTIAERTRQSLHTSAQFSLTLEVDMTEALARRRKLGGEVRVSYTDIIIKACAEALRRHPRLNAAVIGDEIHVYKRVHIGLAVALDDGLLVPVIRDADSKGLAEIAHESADLTARARAGKLLPEETAGGTFTVSSLGIVDTFTPILNSPQCAILGVGRVVEKPIVRKGQVEVRSMVGLSLTVDHRAVDGAPAAAFLRRLRQLIELPAVIFGDAASD